MGTRRGCSSRGGADAVPEPFDDHQAARSATTCRSGIESQYTLASLVVSMFMTDAPFEATVINRNVIAL
jgi:hypothetical protein